MTLFKKFSHLYEHELFLQHCLLNYATEAKARDVYRSVLLFLMSYLSTGEA